MATFNPGHSSIQSYGRATNFTSSSGHWRSAGQSRASGRQARGNIKVEFDMSRLELALRGCSIRALQKDQKFRRMIVAAAMPAKKAIVEAARSKVPIDPREAWKSIRLSVFANRKIGAMVSIHDDIKVDTSSPLPTLKRGGSSKRSSRTAQILSYHGRSRAFILRFLNTGTRKRQTNTRARYNRGAKKYDRKVLNKGLPTYNRGRIKPRRFFKDVAEPAMQQAADRFMAMLAEYVNQNFEKA